MAELWESKVQTDSKFLDDLCSMFGITKQEAAISAMISNQAVLDAKLDHAISQNAEILSRLPPALVVGVKCGTCGGSGKLPVGDYADSKPCHDCKGTGKRL